MKRTMIIITLNVLSIFVLVSSMVLAGEPKGQPITDPEPIITLQSWDTETQTVVWRVQTWDLQHDVSHSSFCTAKDSVVLDCGIIKDDGSYLSTGCDVGKDPSLNPPMEWATKFDFLQKVNTTRLYWIQYAPEVYASTSRSCVKAGPYTLCQEIDRSPCGEPNGEPIGDSPPRSGFQPPIIIDDSIISDIGPPTQ